MEEKKEIKISLSTFFLILTIITIIVMGIFIYKLNNDKTAEIQKSTELQAQVNRLNVTLSDLQGKINNISGTIDYDDIILDGNYAIPASDNIWDFTKDGKVASSGNISVDQGTYKTTGKNFIEIHYTKNKLWDIETGEVKISDIDKYEYLTVDDNKNIYVISPYGEKIELQRYGEVVKENLE